jgi:hypothetical protein
MNLDFRKLGHFDQQKAVANLIRLEDGRTTFIAYLLADEDYDLYSWFNLANTEEGWKYWYNVKNKIDEKV